MAGGVEGQQPGPLPPREGKGQQAFRQLTDRLLIGPHQICGEVFGLDAEIEQGAGSLHQGAAHQGTPRAVHGQGKLGGGGLGVQLPGAVHDEAAGTPLQQSGLQTQPGQHPLVLQILPRSVQGQGKQDPLPRPRGQLLRPSDHTDLPAGQRAAQHPVQAALPLPVLQGRYAYVQHHGITFLMN